MKPDSGSNQFLAITRAKAKMYEYFVPDNFHITLPDDPARLFILSIGILGDLAARYSRGEEVPISVTKDLLFSAHFFDSYLQSRLEDNLDPYLLILGATSYYLCNIPGSASVLSNRIDYSNLDLNCDGLESLLVWLLNGHYNDESTLTSEMFVDQINTIRRQFSEFFLTGLGEEDLFSSCAKLRLRVYQDGTPRQLLLADAIYSVVKRKYQNSTWHSLPTYSNLTRDQWFPVLIKDGFIKELWPAQHLLGNSGIYRGVSAVVQMPTSAGKTKSTELIIRSAFISDRTQLAIIVAPFRALCHEIKNNLSDAFTGEDVDIDELTDVFQTDFDFEEQPTNKKVLITTPEKLLYILRHTPEIAQSLGLLILDEGHQFDSGIRGVTYELLLTSLRSLLPENCQKVIMSAVIGNADHINEWFNGADSVVINGNDLLPTFKSMGFVSWTDTLGQVQYVSDKNIEERTFFVPRVIQSIALEKKAGERKERLFPKKNDGKTVSLYLGLKLVPNGGVAIFCGTKGSVSSLQEIATDIYDRDVDLPAPESFSDRIEVEKLLNLYTKNLGVEAISTKCAQLGIFSHDGNTPHGIRLAVEHAMHVGKARFVICTSTLSQGVNLPIRYLIIDGFYQGAERIKNRDFHNLIGRAGRSGMHTEGSVLFADPLIYDRKRVRRESWKWRQVKNLVDPSNSEPCASNLLSLFDPIHNDEKKQLLNIDVLKLLSIYVENPDEVNNLAAKLANKYSSQGFSENSIGRQLDWKMSIIAAIESFLMFNMEDDSKEETFVVPQLVEGTLAYFLANDEQKSQLREIFKVLSTNISNNVADKELRKIYGRTLYGLWDAKEIESWVNDNFDKLLVTDQDDLVGLFWPLLSSHISNQSFIKSSQPDTMKDLLKSWVGGFSFDDLFAQIEASGTKLIWGSKFREYQIDNIVDICENGFAYEGILLLGAVIEFIDNLEFEGKQQLIFSLQSFQKRLKYGLPLSESVIIHEMGFADRVISQELVQLLGSFNLRFEAIFELRAKFDEAKELISTYPSYYGEILNQYAP